MVAKKITKTVSEIVHEYVNRQGNPQYEEIGVRSDEGQSYSYSNVTNLNENFYDEHGLWIVFDSEYRGKRRHIKIKGWVARYVEDINRGIPEKKVTHKKYRKIVIVTHSGKRETYEDVSDIIEDTYNGIIEFDALVEGEKVHFFKNPGRLEHSEEVIESVKE